MLVDLVDTFGHIDIYLFDQLVRGRIRPGMRVLDAGCGAGRNLLFLLKAGYDVRACDEDGRAVDEVRRLAAQLAPRLPASNFRVEPVERLSFETGSCDAVISSAVLHFARDEAQFGAMLDAMWRVLQTGGVLFARLASTIGIEHAVVPRGGRRFTLPDGSTRFLVDEPMLSRITRDWSAALLDPIKTTLVHEQRSMTTWVVRKP
ncbi:MAG: class I SAM-dependent methyltransferase [Steroidobacteraceae bacterium]